eukprot:COSAG06_NODE_895_length_11669_cov_5.131384_8_plen_71_part_00
MVPNVYIYITYIPRYMYIHIYTYIYMVPNVLIRRGTVSAYQKVWPIYRLLVMPSHAPDHGESLRYAPVTA